MEPQDPAGSEPSLPPFVIEGARSSRSRCKVCRRAINQGVLRLGVLIEGPYGTGYLWHHLACAARRKFEVVAEAYAAEAWKEARVSPERVPSLDDLQKTREEADERRKSRKQIPYVERAPSGRARCKQCGEPIDKDTLRVVLGRAISFGNQVRTSPMHVHPRCVAAALEAEDCSTAAAGFGDALRANSEGFSPEQVEAVLVEIGEPA